jgi:hypothetical protein
LCELVRFSGYNVCEPNVLDKGVSIEICHRHRVRDELPIRGDYGGPANLLEAEYVVNSWVTGALYRRIILTTLLGTDRANSNAKD